MNSNRPPIIKQVQKSVSKEELEDFPSLKPIKQVQKSISKDKLEDIPQENPNKKNQKEFSREITKEILINPVLHDLENWTLHDLEAIEESIRLMKKKVKSQRKKKEDMEESNGMCVVCVTKKSCMVIIPCGHLSLCESCSGQLRKCPICRGDVTNFIKTFVT